MTGLRALETFIRENPSRAVVEVTRARGSTPREEGAWMLVSPVATLGTIGGGALEFMAIDRARAALAGHVAVDAMDVPLGPDIGQCCGGRVELSIRLMDDAATSDLVERQGRADAAMPHILVFGGGHVGHALAAAFALLPVKVTIVETRAEALEGMPNNVSVRLTPVPEEAVRDAPAGSAIVVLTHDHALDFLIVAEALGRGDLPYVGMIGSKTKRATFRSWYLKEAGGSAEALARLVSPIGGDHVRDKRPAVIAALAAAEIMTALAAAEK
ncbi:MAG: xanthine dehydrogenase accessory protein XdhC [Mesorhizobium sp.]